jgi:hypothetical protein
VLFIAIACGGRTKPAPRTAYDELAARMPPLLDAIDRLAGTLRDADGDCPAIAGALRKFGDAHAQDLREVGELMGRLTPEEREHWQFEHDVDDRRVQRVVVEVSAACAGDAQVAAALDIAGFRVAAGR